jgi:periodic tryptophan protein 2
MLSSSSNSGITGGGRPQLNQRLAKILGTPYANGNLLFSGDSILAPVGNRVTMYNLVQQSSVTLPFETRKNVKRVAVSHSGRFLVMVDVEGQALFVNLPRRVILHRFHFKRKVYDLKFSPDDSMFAATFGHGVQIWKTPGVARTFAPLTLMRTISGHNDDVTCLDWSSDNQSIIMGSKDLGARIYYRVSSKNMAMTVLSGHRDRLMGCYFDASGDSAYTVARDGAVFTWKFEHGERHILDPKRKRQRTAIAKDEDDSEEEEDDETEDEEEVESEKKTKRGGAWKLHAREFLWDPHTQVSSTAFNRAASLLVIGFSNGVFGLYEMPGCINVHRLSVSNHSLSTACINGTGEWLALGSSRLGQLLVWEWQSETYVVKQQGHLYGLNALDYSSDGQYVASGGEDGKVKLWNAATGMSFATFSEHVAPITGVKFVGKGQGRAVLSSSLDGTVRAHDLLRYKNFRTLTTPSPVQFTSLSADASGEVVCAGSMDPFQIYVWALQTGRLVDVLSGHEGPLSCLDFGGGAGAGGSLLASGSWDGTLKLWDVYKTECVETFEHGCDVLAVAFRPDGKEIACAAINGNIYFWDVEQGQQISVIEGRRDIAGGRLSTDAVTAENSAKSKCFTCLVYTADGSCVLAGGRSKFVCVYAVASGLLVKKFQLSHNRSMEGITDRLNSAASTDGVRPDSIAVFDGDSEDELLAASTAPGAGKGSGGRDGSRTTRPEITSACLRFSPTGRDWAVATTQGLQVFSVDPALLFAPLDIDVSITPQTTNAALAQGQFSQALGMALQLGEGDLIRRVATAVPVDAIPLVARQTDPRLLGDMLRFLADELTLSRHVEFFLQWCLQLLSCCGAFIQAGAGGDVTVMPAVRSLIRAIGTCPSLLFFASSLFSLLSSHRHPPSLPPSLPPSSALQE